MTDKKVVPIRPTVVITELEPEPEPEQVSKWWFLLGAMLGLGC